MSEKRRTLILLILLFSGLFFLWLLTREIDTNFVNQF